MIFCCLILGGGTSQGLWTDHLLELAMMPALFFGLAGFTTNRLDVFARALSAVILVLLAAQFLPIIRSLPIDGSETGIGFLSPAPQKSLEASLFTVSVLGLFLYVARMSDRDQERCLPFFYSGVAVNILIGIVQLSYSGPVAVADLLPFTIKSGLFANENHLSSLVFAAIPLLACSLVAKAGQKAVFAAISVLVVGFLFAVGSRAGMAFSAVFGVASLIWFWPEKRSRRFRTAAILLGVTGLAVGYGLFGTDSAISNDLRWTFFSTTWNAIGDHWLTGSGLGTFTLVYPSYESPDQVVRVFANHAHNDYLEIFLETGIAGVVLIAAYYVLVIRGFGHSKLAEAATISIAALSLHSLVDYPLRTMALAAPFAFLSGIVLSRGEGRPAGNGEKPAKLRKASAKPRVRELS